MTKYIWLGDILLSYIDTMQENISIDLANESHLRKQCGRDKKGVLELHSSLGDLTITDEWKRKIWHWLKQSTKLKIIDKSSYGAWSRYHSCPLTQPNTTVKHSVNLSLCSNNSLSGMLAWAAADTSLHRYGRLWTTAGTEHSTSYPS